jgi:hypothetical protein
MAALQTNLAVLVCEFASRAAQIAHCCGDAEAAEKLDQLCCDLLAVLLREFAFRATQLARSCEDAEASEKLYQLSCDFVELAKSA